MTERILYLTLKKRWFDMILYGEKKEEYREIKPYWINRLMHINAPEEQKGENKVIPENIVFDIENNKSFGVSEIFKSYQCEFKKFDYIIFSNGYGTKAPKIKVEFKGLSVGQPAFKWYGAPTRYIVTYIVSLGKVVDTYNVSVPRRKLSLLPGSLQRQSRQ